VDLVPTVGREKGQWVALQIWFNVYHNILMYFVTCVCVFCQCEKLNTEYDLHGSQEGRHFRSGQVRSAQS